MQPLARKSVELMAARLEPARASAKHQALHHFMAKAEWSDKELLARVAQWVVPKMSFTSGGWWIIDDTGFPKKGRHSVGVTRQYCGVLGKQDNCQVAVSATLASDSGSLPVAWQLYLPEVLAEDQERRAKAGVPPAIEFQTKTAIALSQIRSLLAAGAPSYPVLADAGYGVDTGFRQALSDLGLRYGMGITSAVVVWPPGVEPQPPLPSTGTGRPPVQPRRTADRQPTSDSSSRESVHRCLRIPDGRATRGRKTRIRQKKLHSTPKACRSRQLHPPAAVLRAQRHVPTSIATLRHELAIELIARLSRCPCCGRQSE